MNKVFQLSVVYPGQLSGYGHDDLEEILLHASRSLRQGNTIIISPPGNPPPTYMDGECGHRLVCLSCDLTCTRPRPGRRRRSADT